MDPHSTWTWIGCDIQRKTEFRLAPLGGPTHIFNQGQWPAWLTKPAFKKSMGLGFAWVSTLGPFGMCMNCNSPGLHYINMFAWFQLLSLFRVNLDVAWNLHGSQPDLLTSSLAAPCAGRAPRPCGKTSSEPRPGSSKPKTPT